MGLFDRFKKKEKTFEEKKVEPLVLKYTDGTTANIEFAGMCEVDGKSLHTANIHYINEDGTFVGKSVLLEPITGTGDNGIPIDATEAYYKWMAKRDGSIESQSRYNAVKGFFKKQEITEEKIGSNYIGNIAQNENGEYYRHYDNEFRTKYVAKTREIRTAEEKERLNREEDFAKGLREQVNNDYVHVKTSHAEILTPDKNPYESR